MRLTVWYNKKLKEINKLNSYISVVFSVITVMYKFMFKNTVALVHYCIISNTKLYYLYSILHISHQN